ncbi:hypothetical protein [Staphylococcus agnetis]|uniref:hypothetical protein n=1 Tax=Staphylococcus agnetis TaxID=985762 RepID=UPI000D1A56E8|nr:hypothetical protein [Staphylococcus agnetis]PTH75594.1 hypothetical protein BU579_11710 [Staphylococcus agnetis]
MQNIVKVIWFIITAILAVYFIFNEVLLGLGLVLFFLIFWAILLLRCISKKEERENNPLLFFIFL